MVTVVLNPTSEALDLAADCGLFRLPRSKVPAGQPGLLVPVGRVRLNPGSDQGMYDVSADWKYVDVLVILSLT